MKNDSDDFNHQHLSSLQRWSQRKLDHSTALRHNDLPPKEPASQSPLSINDNNKVTHAEKVQLPDIDSLTEDSDLAAFFSEQVSDALRKTALRKIFHLAKFNVCDGLDDYAEDYTAFESLEKMALVKPRWSAKSKANNQSESTDESANPGYAKTDNNADKANIEVQNFHHNAATADSHEKQLFQQPSAEKQDHHQIHQDVDREPRDSSDA